MTPLMPRIATRDSLLSRLKDHADHESWREFLHLYRPLVMSVALQAGLNEQESEEVVQETMITVSRRIAEFQYNPAKCSFKTWLMNLTRWRIIDQVRKRQRDRARRAWLAPDETRTGTALIDRVPDPAGLPIEQLWEKEWEQQLLQAASERVKQRVAPEQFQIFALCFFKDLPVRQVAQRLRLNLAQVYLAKHRVGKIFRQEVRRLRQLDALSDACPGPSPLDAANRPPPGN